LSTWDAPLLAESGDEMKRLRLSLPRKYCGFSPPEIQYCLKCRKPPRQFFAIDAVFMDIAFEHIKILLKMQDIFGTCV
jgi:hypothetical protein